jgi:anti-anti-sigma factor
LADSSDLTQFAVEVHKIKTGIHIEVHGDLDLTSVRALDAQLHSSTKDIEQASPGEKIILDIRDLVFIDSAGLALLIKVSKQLSANERVLRVVMKRVTQPERILKIGHFDKILELGYDVND